MHFTSRFRRALSTLGLVLVLLTPLLPPGEAGALATEPAPTFASSQMASMALSLAGPAPSVPTLDGLPVQGTASPLATGQSSQSVAAAPFPALAGATLDAISVSTPRRMFYGMWELTALAISLDGRKQIACNGRDAVLVDLMSGAWETRFIGHPGEISSAAFSSDGRRVLLSNGRGSEVDAVTVWDAVSGALLQILRGCRQPIAFSPDGQQVAGGDMSGSRMVYLWDVSSGAITRTLNITSTAQLVAFSPNGQRLLCVADPYAGIGPYLASLWDTATGSLVRSLPVTQTVTGAAFSPDGGRIATISDASPQSVCVWDAVTGALLLAVRSTYNVTSVAFSPDGRRVLAGCLSVTGLVAQMWDATSGVPLRTYIDQGIPPRVGGSLTAAFAANGQRVILANSARLVSGTYDAASGVCQALFTGISAPTSVAPSPDGRQILMVQDRMVFLWDTISGALLGSYGHDGAAEYVAFAQHGRILTVGSGYAYLWDVGSGARLRTFQANDIAAQARFALSPDGQRVLANEADGTLVLWDANSGAVLRRFGHAASICSLTFSPDGQYALASEAAGLASLWNMRDGTLAQTFPRGVSYCGFKVAFAPDGRTVLTSNGGYIQMWDAASGMPGRSIGPCHAGGGFAMTPDGRRIVTWEPAQLTRWWDVDTGVMLHFSRPCTPVTFLPNGRQMLTGNELWDMPYMTKPALDLPASYARSVSLSPDGTRVLTVDAGAAKLWDAASGALLHTMQPGSSRGVLGAIFHPDGRQVLTVEGNGYWSDSVSLWDTTTGVLSRTMGFRGATYFGYETTIAFSSDGHWLVVPDQDTEGYRQLDIANWAVSILDIPQPRRQDGLALSADGRLMLESSSGVARLWDRDSCTLLRTLRGVGVHVCMALSPDGRQALIGELEDGEGVGLWDLATGRLLRWLPTGGMGGVVAFSSDGRMLAAGGPDGPQVWDTATGELVFAVGRDGANPSYAYAFAANDLAILTSTSSGAVLSPIAPSGLRTPTRLSLGAPLEGTVRPYEWRDYAVEITAGLPLVVEVAALTGTQSLELYGRAQELPTTSRYELWSAALTPRGAYEIVMPPGPGGVLNAGVYGRDMALTGGAFRILARTLNRYLSDVSPRSAGNAGEVMLRLAGLGFAEGLRVELRRSGSPTLVAGSVSLASPTALWAPFDLRGAPIGTYDIAVIWPAGPVEYLLSAFNVVPGVGARLALSIEGRRALRAEQGGGIYRLHYQNSGDADMPTPFVWAASSVSGTIRALSMPSPVLGWAAGGVGSGGIFPPGGAGYLPFSVAPPRSGLSVSVGSVNEDDTAFDWEAVERVLKPAGYPEDSWRAFWAVATARIGMTCADVYRTLRVVQSQHGGTASYDGLMRMALLLAAEGAIEASPAFAGGTQPEAGLQYDPDADVKIITCTSFISTHATIVLTHGWGGTEEEQRFKALQLALAAEYTQCNVVRVTWEVGASGHFWDVSARIGAVAEAALAKLRALGYVPRWDTMYIGESFGNGVNTEIARFSELSGASALILNAAHPSGYAFNGEPQYKSWFRSSIAIQTYSLGDSMDPPVDRQLFSGDPRTPPFTGSVCDILAESHISGIAYLQKLLTGTNLQRGFARKLIEGSIKEEVADQPSAYWDGLLDRYWIIQPGAYPKGAIIEPDCLASPSVTATIAIVRPIDPNEKRGPAGLGVRRIVALTDTLEYTLYFENVITATAPAQVVVVADSLDTALDWGSLRFTEIGFGDRVIGSEDASLQFAGRETVADYRPEVTKTWWVDIAAEVNPWSGRARWTLRTLDPDTGELPEDALAGFLPPNDSTHRGEGHVSFTIRPKADTRPGTLVSNQALIVFDTNEPIETNMVTNTLGLEADLALTKTGSAAHVAYGQALTYTLSVANNGPDTAEGVVLTDTLPVSVTLASAACSQGACSGAGPVVCTLGAIAPGGVVTVTLRGAATPLNPAGGVITNTARLASGTPDLDWWNDAATLTTTVGAAPPSAPRAMVLTGPTTGLTGASYTFDASVTPITVTRPLTYIWTATGLAGVTHTGGGPSDSVSFTWPTAGTKTVSLTARNALGQVVGSRSLGITLAAWAPAARWSTDFGGSTGWTTYITYPRALADVNGDSRADVVGFGATDVWVATSSGSGLGVMRSWSKSFCASTGWVSQDTYPRLLGDVNGDGKADIVGFGCAGVYTALASPTGIAPPAGLATLFGPMTLRSPSFGACPSAGGWASQDMYPRLLGDVNGDGKADIVGFGAAGGYVALSTGTGFGPMTRWSTSFGFLPTAGGWASQDLYPRLLADVNGDGKADIVGFGALGVYVALSRGTSFAAMSPLPWIRAFGAAPAGGGWSSQDLYPRTLADLNADGKADIVAFGVAGTYYSLSTGSAFNGMVFGSAQFGAAAAAGGWASQNSYPRFAADINHDHKADLLGFGSAGVWVALHN